MYCSVLLAERSSRRQAARGFTSVWSRHITHTYVTRITWNKQNSPNDRQQLPARYLYKKQLQRITSVGYCTVNTEAGTVGTVPCVSRQSSNTVRADAEKLFLKGGFSQIAWVSCQRYYSKALFKAFHRRAYNFNFIKGTLNNERKTLGTD